MKRFRGIIKASMVVLILIVGFSLTPIMGSRNAGACGWGSSSSGGGNYVPKRRSLSGVPDTTYLTKEQAQEVLNSHVRSLNPDLKVGSITDNGSYYDAEIIAKNGEVVEHLTVDKESGGIVPSN